MHDSGDPIGSVDVRTSGNADKSGGPVVPADAASTKPQGTSGNIAFPQWVDPLVILVCLGLGIYVALSPGTTYAPTPKVILFLLVSLIPGILLASRSSAYFEMKLPGFLITVTGAGAIVFASLTALIHFAKPEQQIAIYRIEDKDGQPFSVEPSGAVELYPDASSGLIPSKFVDGATMILIFPEQLGTTQIAVRDVATKGQLYKGTVTYSGSRQAVLRLGKDLTL